MENRLNTSKKLLSQGEGLSCYPRKNKKRSNRKSALLNNWINDGQRDQSNGMMSNMEYSQVLWQPEMQQNLPNQNGQRLFAAVSDPSVCGYSPLPMTYTVEPVSLPTMYRLYQPVPLPGVRTIHNRPRQNFNQTHTMPMHPNPRVMPNGYTSLQDNKADSSMLSSYQNGDYASLPPTANKSNGVNEEELNSEHRRYSDPGLGPTEPQVHSHSDDSDSVDSESSITTIGRSNKLVLSLIEQMTELKKSNGQLFKELNETKFELENMKAKLTQYKHSVSSDYQPGMLSDLIREIREANKLCEEGLVAKVQLIVEERHKQKSTEVEQLRTQLLKLAKEKEESDKRISKLEKEVATLKVHASNEGREIAAFEEETLALRRELQEALATRSHAADVHASKTEKPRNVTTQQHQVPLESGHASGSGVRATRSTSSVLEVIAEAAFGGGEASGRPSAATETSSSSSASSVSTSEIEDECSDGKEWKGGGGGGGGSSSSSRDQRDSQGSRGEVAAGGANHHLSAGPVTDL